MLPLNTPIQHHRAAYYQQYRADSISIQHPAAHYEPSAIQTRDQAYSGSIPVRLRFTAIPPSVLSSPAAEAMGKEQRL
jgi:hypothetical protein